MAIEGRGSWVILAAWHAEPGWRVVVGQGEEACPYPIVAWAQCGKSMRFDGSHLIERVFRILPLIAKDPMEGVELEICEDAVGLLSSGVTMRAWEHQRERGLDVLATCAARGERDAS